MSSFRGPGLLPVATEICHSATPRVSKYKLAHISANAVLPKLLKLGKTEVIFILF